jgi:chromosome partitioning protein
MYHIQPQSSILQEKIMSTITIAICNQKGGVGKTTLTINLGGALAELGYKVLMIDLDPQGHLTEGVGLRDFYDREDISLYDQLVNSKGKVSDLIVKPDHEAFYVIPTNYQMMLAEQSLFMSRNREHKLKNMLSKLNDEFDWVLLDCPPTLGNLTDNALNAAQKVVVPVQAESTSIRALELLFDQIESIEHGLGIKIKKLAVVPNLVQDSAISKRTLEDLRRHVPNVTPFELRKRVVLQNAWDEGRSIFHYETTKPDHIKAKKEVVEDYLRLANFVNEHVMEGNEL